MKMHRGLFLGLGLAALLALPAPEATAGNITMTISWTGHSLTIDFTSPFAQAGSTANNLTINTSALNANLAANGSAYSFADLGAASNNPGVANPTGSILGETGTAILSNTLGDKTILIDTTQTAFTIPSGPGTLFAGSTALFTNAGAGDTQKSGGSLDGFAPSALTFTNIAGGPNPQPYSGSNSIAATGNPAGYPLEVNTTLTLGNGLDQFTTAVRFLGVPEPASLVMMLTGIPLPLVLMGLLRRRRAAA